MNSEGKKVYTLKESIEENETTEAHYKFIKIRDAPTNNNFIQKR